MFAPLCFSQLAIAALRQAAPRGALHGTGKPAHYHGAHDRAGDVAGRKVRKDEADAIGAYLVLDGKLMGLTLQEAEQAWGQFWSTR